MYRNHRLFLFIILRISYRARSLVRIAQKDKRSSPLGEKEIKGKDKENNDSSVLVVTIDTIHWERIIATLILVDSASVDVTISCQDDFPKDELNLRLNAEGKNYSAKTNYSYAISKNLVSQKFEKSQATINMSDTNEINPYLLLVAHQIIHSDNFTNNLMSD